MLASYDPAAVPFPRGRYPSIFREPRADNGFLGDLPALISWGNLKLEMLFSACPPEKQRIADQCSSSTQLVHSNNHNHTRQPQAIATSRTVLLGRVAVQYLRSGVLPISPLALRDWFACAELRELADLAPQQFVPQMRRTCCYFRSLMLDSYFSRSAVNIRA